MTDPYAWLALALAALFIGVSKAGFGGGTGLLVGPVLVLFFDPKETVGLMLPLLFACDVISFWWYWRKWDTRNIVVLIPGAVVGIVLGALTLEHMSSRGLEKTIGALAVGFALLQVVRIWVLRKQTKLEPRLWHGSIVGLGTGYVSTLSHVGGILTNMYLIPQELDSETYVGTTTAVYFLVNLFKVPFFVWNGLIDEAVLWTDLPLLPVVFAGTAMGVWLNRRVSSAWFTKIVLVLVLATGAFLLLRG